MRRRVACGEGIGMVGPILNHASRTRTSNSMALEHGLVGRRVIQRGEAVVVD